jgi:hypothetical protein
MRLVILEIYLRIYDIGIYLKKIITKGAMYVWKKIS